MTPALAALALTARRRRPAPDAPQYPLPVGLPAGSTLTNADAARRVDDCLGTARPAAQRTPEQARKLKTITDVPKTP